MDSSQNAYNEDTSLLVERLDGLERALFQAGQSGLNDFQRWEKGHSSHLTASSLVLNYRKRKIMEVQEWGAGELDGPVGGSSIFFRLLLCSHGWVTGSPFSDSCREVNEHSFDLNVWSKQRTNRPPSWANGNEELWTAGAVKTPNVRQNK